MRKSWGTSKFLSKMASPFTVKSTLIFSEISKEHAVYILFEFFIQLIQKMFIQSTDFF